MQGNACSPVRGLIETLIPDKYLSLEILNEEPDWLGADRCSFGIV